MRRPTPTPQGNANERGAATPPRNATPEIRSTASTVAGTSDPGKRDVTLADVRRSLEALLRLADLAEALNVSGRTIERLRSAGLLPRPDLMLGVGARKSPRWKPETIRQWIEQGGDR